MVIYDMLAYLKTKKGHEVHLRGVLETKRREKRHAKSSKRESGFQKTSFMLCHESEV